MATIRKRGARWQAQVRLQGHAPVTKSFTHRADTEAWARQQEVAIERGEIQSARRSLKTHILADLLARYQFEVPPKKRGASSEVYRVKALKAAAIATLPLDRLTPSVLAGYRDTRLKVVSPSSVRREMAIIQNCLEVARKEWGVPMLGNPMTLVTKPTPARARIRRLTPDDALKIAEGVAGLRNRLLADIIHFAIATGMRRGEILDLRWSNVDEHTAYLPLTKNGERTRHAGPIG